VPLFEQELLRPGRYHIGAGHHRTFSKSDLRRYMNHTRKLLRSGYTVPVFREHAPAGIAAGGPRRCNADVSNDFTSHRPVGHLADIWQTESGEIHQRIWIEPGQDSRRVEKGELRHTSPELRETFVDQSGKTTGPLICHIALTNSPRHRQQPRLQRATGVLQFSLTDFVEGTVSMTEDVRPVDANIEPDDSDTQQNTIDHNDSASSLSESDESLRVITANDEPTDAPPDTTPEPGAEELRDNRSREHRRRLCARIVASRRLPKGLKDRLVGAVEAVQLSDDGAEEPSLSVTDAVAIIEDSIPSQLALVSEGYEQKEHPQGEGFFTGAGGQLSDAEADRIAAEQLANTGYAPK